MSKMLQIQQQVLSTLLRQLLGSHAKSVPGKSFFCHTDGRAIRCAARVVHKKLIFKIYPPRCDGVKAAAEPAKSVVCRDSAALSGGHSCAEISPARSAHCPVPRGSRFTIGTDSRCALFRIARRMTLTNIGRGVSAMLPSSLTAADALRAGRVFRTTAHPR